VFLVLMTIVLYFWMLDSPTEEIKKEDIHIEKSISILPHFEDIYCPKTTSLETIIPTWDCRGHGSWLLFTESERQIFITKLAQAAEFKVGDILFEWGCDCGQNLHWLHERSGRITALGLDPFRSAIQIARKKRNPNLLFCDIGLKIDMNYLNFIPDEIFDHSISFGSLYELSMRDQCTLLRQMIRITKGGGTIWGTFVKRNEDPTFFSNCLIEELYQIKWQQMNQGLFTGIAKENKNDTLIYIQKMEWPE